MTRLQKHASLKKLIRTYISLRLVKLKRRVCEDYPNGNCNIYGKRITIYYLPSDSLDWIDSLIIHEMGHYLAANRYGFFHHPVSEPNRIIEEEIRAWKEAERWITPNYSHLIPKKYEWIKKYCLDTYRFVYESRKLTNNRGSQKKVN